MKLNNKDLQYVLANCPRDIIKLLKDNPGKMFLAGGFIRSIISGDTVNDIDLFGCNKEYLIHQANNLAEQRNSKIHKTENAFTILTIGRIPIQFITRWTFDDPLSLVNSFDFTVCQAIIWAEGDQDCLINFNSLCSDDFYPDLAAKRLCYTNPIRDEEAGGSMMRVLKFLKRGYSIQTFSLAGVITRLISKVDFKKTGDNDEQIQTIITSLLREVDPLTIIDGVGSIDPVERKIESVH